MLVTGPDGRGPTGGALARASAAESATTKHAVTSTSRLVIIWISHKHLRDPHPARAAHREKPRSLRRGIGASRRRQGGEPCARFVRRSCFWLPSRCWRYSP